MNPDTQEVSPANMGVSTETISEPTFLLTELRYTLGQLHVQLGDLDDQSRQTMRCGDRSVDDILQEMLEYESRYQAEYAQMLQTSVPQEGADQQFRGHAAFEQRRAQTVAMLEAAGEDWPPQLIETVKQQIARDRASTTQIAECRKAAFETDQRPDLDEPLTQEP